MDLDDEFQDLEPVGSFPHASDNVMRDRRVVKARRGAEEFPPLVQSIDDEPFSVDGLEEEMGFEGDLDELLGLDENVRANDPNLDVVDLGSESAYRDECRACALFLFFILAIYVPKAHNHETHQRFQHVFALTKAIRMCACIAHGNRQHEPQVFDQCTCFAYV
jgi:hypothetical protein